MSIHCANDDCQRIAIACVKHKKAAIDMKERCSYQKKKLDEYREMNMKLYDDVADLETDIKEKDDFLNRLTKKRNDLENEVKHLIETTELQNEENVKISFFSNKQKEIFEGSIKSLEEENNALKENLNTAFRTIESHEKERIALRTKEESTTNNLFEDMKVLEEEIKNLMKTNQEKEVLIKQLVKDKEGLDDEVLALQVETKDSDRNTSEASDETRSFQSLADELNLCGIINLEVTKFNCRYCDNTFGSKTQLKMHIDSIHIKEAAIKLSRMEEKLFNQAVIFASSVKGLIKKEIFETKEPCTCKGFCTISHLKHNWRKSPSDELLKKFEEIRKVERENVMSNLHCLSCEQTFNSSQNLEVHAAVQHADICREGESQSGEVE
jgi:DNA repair exonuclease SbcCD ATPase subunit